MSPVRISVNGEPREVAPGTALDALVGTLTAAPSGVAAALNETESLPVPAPGAAPVAVVTPPAVE